MIILIKTKTTNQTRIKLLFDPVLKLYIVAHLGSTLFVSPSLVEADFYYNAR